MKAKVWSMDEEACLRRTYPDQSSAAIAVTLGRTSAGVRSRAKKLHLRKRVQRKYWSLEDERYLRETYPDQSTSAIAVKLGRRIGQVYQKARKLGLEKSATYLAKYARLQPGHAIGRIFQFPKGHVPANKGLRRPGYSEGRGRMQTTQFQKGGQPRNTLPVGTIKPNADGYLRIKVSDLPETPGQRGANSPNWEYVHKRVWEAAHGPIPPGHRIWWKDGNHQNCALENLELLSDKEHMRRTTIHNLPPDLKDTIQQLGRLKRRIRKMTKEGYGEKQNGRPAESSLRNTGSAQG